MTHRLFSIVCCSLMTAMLAGTCVGAGFIHPGVSHNQAELAFVRSKLKAQAQPWQEAWEEMLSSKEADLAWQTRAVAHVERGAYNRPDIGGSFFMRGGKAAYTHALLWVLTDKEAHAQKAAEILNAWSATLESVTNHDAKLLVGMGGLQFCNAAEILKHTWKGWPAEDQQAFGRMLQDVFYPVIQDFFPRANGNWDASMIQTMMAMGIFLDDRVMFQKAVDYYLNGVGNGAVNHYFHESGQCQESGRDQGHTQMGLEYLVNSAEIAWKQGVDLYSAHDNRLAAGFEYTAKYNQGQDVPFEYYESYQGKYKHHRISGKSRGRLRPMYDKIVNHYHGRMGLDMPWSRKALNETRPEAGGTMPWSTLMYADQPAGLVALAVSQASRSRLIILADMGNEPDEVQQMTHMIMCSNEFELEGLIAVSGIYLRPESKEPYRRVLHPELFTEIIDAYAKVYSNLQKHASGWHTPEYLHSIVAAGQPGYGFDDVGKGKSSPGSELIIKAVTRDDPRPVWIVVNAGSNTLAQALRDFQATHSPSQVEAFVAKLRVFENGAQDNCGAWICNRFPKIHWLRSNYQTYCYGGPSHEGAINHTGNRKAIGPHTWEPYAYSFIGQHQWALEHIKGNHGPVGRVWPIRQFGGGNISFLEGGGTIPWLGLVNKGLFSTEHPDWGGWSGRFSRDKAKNYMSKHKRVRNDEEKVGDFSLYREEADQWINPENGDEYSDIFTPIWRWRRAFFNNFKCRMDWCLNPYDKANHHPVAVFGRDKDDTIIRRQARPDQTISLDARSSSDPDNDKLAIRWYTYPEAGTYTGKVTIIDSEQAQASVTIPTDAAGKQIHVILEVKDLNAIASLYDYRRIVIDVSK